MPTVWSLAHGADPVDQGKTLWKSTVLVLHSTPLNVGGHRFEAVRHC